MMLNVLTNRKEVKEMNTKIGALVAVAVMLCASFVVLGAVAESGDGATDTTVSIGKNDTVGEAVMLWFSESQYNVDNVSSYTVTWAAAVSANSASEGYGNFQTLGVRTTTLGDNGSVGPLKAGTDSSDSDGTKEVTLVDNGQKNRLNVHLTGRTDDDGNVANNYLLNIRNYIDDGGSASSAPTVYLKVTATVGLTMAAGNTVTIDALTYTITVNVTNDTMTVSLADNETITERTDTDVSLKVTIGDKNVNVGDYTWYAKGLPTGLSMSKDGRIVGYPLTSGDVKNVEVIAEDSSGKTYHAVLSFTISENDTTPSVSITVDSTKANNGQVFNTKAGDDGFDFTVNTENAAVSLVVAIDKTTGEYSILTSTDGSYTVDTSGTGAYNIYAYAVSENGSSINTSIQLYVIAAPVGAVSAGIISSSQATADVEEP